LHAPAKEPILVRVIKVKPACIRLPTTGQHSRTVNYSWRVPWSIRRSLISVAVVLLVAIVLAYVVIEQLDLLLGLATSSGGE
jgi:hypothetical protein